MRTEAKLRVAFQQGKKDGLAGRSRNAVRYKDPALDREWERGLLDAIKQRRKGKAK